MNSKRKNNNSKMLFHRLFSLGERKKGWLITSQRNKGPQFTVGNGVNCGKNSLTFDLVTDRSGQCTNHPCFRS